MTFSTELRQGIQLKLTILMLRSYSGIVAKAMAVEKNLEETIKTREQVLWQ